MQARIPQRLFDSGLDASVPKVVAFPQERLTEVERQGIRESIAEVQTGGVTGALAEICVGLAGQACLAFGHRFDHELGFLDECV